MIDDSDRDTDDSCLSRRGYLASAGGLGASLLALEADTAWPVDQPGDDPSRPRPDPPEKRKDFLWLGGGLFRNETMRENLFAFARRHDLAVILVQGRTRGESLDETLRPPMAAASEFDLDVWLNVGLLNDLPAPEFVTDAAAREAHLDWLRSVARLHGEFFPDGRVILWQEAPVKGQWVAGGAWNAQSVENMLDHGPDVFAAQKRAIRGANDALDVGIFPHFPYVVDSKRPDVFAELADGIRDRGADPDFGFVDFYRGWYEKDVGPEPANAAVRSLISNAREALDDRPVFYLGQSHTIDPKHTPSRQAIRMNLRASIEAGAAGLGWYARNSYVPTESGFDPFVPNVAGAEFDGDVVNTLTVARDRFFYSWLPTLDTRAGFEADRAFDLWLVGDELGFHDHRLSVRTRAGSWEYVGHFGGYADGDYPDGSEATDGATVFRGLDRDRYLGSGSLECRIETRERSSGTSLESVLVMPCEPDAYVTEREAAGFVHGDASLDAFTLGQLGDPVATEPGRTGEAIERAPGGPSDSIAVAAGRTSAPVELPPGETTRVSIPVTDSRGPSLNRLRHPDSVDLIRRLESFETRESVDPSARFDLWVRGEGVSATSDVPSLLDTDGAPKSPANRGVFASTTDLAVCYGLERDRFLGTDGLELAPDVDPAITTCYAMPYAGTAAFRPPTRAAELLIEQPDEVRTFSLDYAEPE